MATLDEIDRLFAYLEDKEHYLYRQPNTIVKPRASRRGAVVWIMKDGVLVDFRKQEDDNIGQKRGYDPVIRGNFRTSDLDNKHIEMEVQHE